MLLLFSVLKVFCYFFPWILDNFSYLRLLTKDILHKSLCVLFSFSLLVLHFWLAYNCYMLFLITLSKILNSPFSSVMLFLLFIHNTLEISWEDQFVTVFLSSITGFVILFLTLPHTGLTSSPILFCNSIAVRDFSYECILLSCLKDAIIILIHVIMLLVQVLAFSVLVFPWTIYDHFLYHWC